MKTMTYSESRQRYAEVLGSVVDDREGVVITRSGRESAVILSLEDYESLRETASLMRSPANARRLLDAMGRSSSASTGFSRTSSATAMKASASPKRSSTTSAASGRGGSPMSTDWSARSSRIVCS